MGRISKQKQRLRAIARLRFEAPIDPCHDLESSFTVATENPIGTEGEVAYTLESGSERKTSGESKRKLDTVEHTNPPSPKRQALPQEPSLPQIRPPPKQFDDSDLSDNYFSDLDESYESDVSTDPETSDDDDAGDNRHQSKVVLEWHPDAGKSLRQRYGSGSRTTSYRQKKRQASLQREASQHYSIKELFKRQEAISREHDASKVVPLSDIAHGRSTEPSLERSMAENARLAASEDLKRLLQLPTLQKKKYGYIMSGRSDFLKRHEMLLSYFWIQQERERFPGVKLKELAQMVAKSYNKGSGYARHLPQWEKSWIENRFIPERKSCGNCGNVSWMNEEDVACATRDFAKSQGESKMYSLNCEMEKN